MSERWVHFSPVRVGDVRSVRQNDLSAKAGIYKPRGFWISDEAAEQSWSAWCKAEDYNGLGITHEVILSPKANLLRLSSPHELDAFTAQYESSHKTWGRLIDWGDVASRYQGILITPYQWSRRLDAGTFWYYGWDCASGCIWDSTAIAGINVLEPAA